MEQPSWESKSWDSPNLWPTKTSPPKQKDASTKRTGRAGDSKMSVAEDGPAQSRLRRLLLTLAPALAAAGLAPADAAELPASVLKPAKEATTTVSDKELVRFANDNYLMPEKLEPAERRDAKDLAVAAICLEAYALLKPVIGTDLAEDAAEHIKKVNYKQAEPIFKRMNQRGVESDDLRDLREVLALDGWEAASKAWLDRALFSFKLSASSVAEKTRDAMVEDRQLEAYALLQPLLGAALAEECAEHISDVNFKQAAPIFTRIDERQGVTRDDLRELGEALKLDNGWKGANGWVKRAVDRFRKSPRPISSYRDYKPQALA